MEGPKALFSITSILNVNQLYSESMGLILRNFAKTVGFTALTAILFTLIIVLSPVGLFVDNVYSVFEYDFSFFSLFNFTAVPWLIVLLICMATVTVMRVSLVVKKQLSNEKPMGLKIQLSVLFGFLLTITLSTFLIATNVFFLMLAGFIILPLLLLMVSISLLQSESLIGAIRLAPQYLKNNWLKFFLISLLLYASVAGLMGVLNFGIGYSIKESLLLTITDNLRTQIILEFSLKVFISIFCFQLLLTLITVAMGHLFFTLKETNTADNLFNRIRSIKVA